MILISGLFTNIFGLDIVTYRNNFFQRSCLMSGIYLFFAITSSKNGGYFLENGLRFLDGQFVYMGLAHGAVAWVHFSKNYFPIKFFSH